MPKPLTHSSFRGRIHVLPRLQTDVHDAPHQNDSYSTMWLKHHEYGVHFESGEKLHECWRAGTGRHSKLRFLPSISVVKRRKTHRKAASLGSRWRARMSRRRVATSPGLCCTKSL